MENILLSVTRWVGSQRQEGIGKLELEDVIDSIVKEDEEEVNVIPKDFANAINTEWGMTAF